MNRTVNTDIKICYMRKNAYKSLIISILPSPPQRLSKCISRLDRPGGCGRKVLFSFPPLVGGEVFFVSGKERLLSNSVFDLLKRDALALSFPNKTEVIS